MNGYILKYIKYKAHSKKKEKNAKHHTYYWMMNGNCASFKSFKQNKGVYTIHLTFIITQSSLASSNIVSDLT